MPRWLLLLYKILNIRLLYDVKTPFFLLPHTYDVSVMFTEAYQHIMASLFNDLAMLYRYINPVLFYLYTLGYIHICLGYMDGLGLGLRDWGHIPEIQYIRQTRGANGGMRRRCEEMQGGGEDVGHGHIYLGGGTTQAGWWASEQRKT